MAAYDILVANSGPTGLANGGTLAMNYIAAGRVPADFVPGTEVLDLPGRQLTQSTLFTMSYQKGQAILTWNGGYTIPANNTIRVSVQTFDASMTPSAQTLQLHPGYLPGRWYPGVEAANTNTAIAAIDVVYLVPFKLLQPITFTSILERVATGGAGSSVKAAIWPDSNLSHRPVGLPLFADNTGVATTATGNVTLAMAGTLKPGFYWFGSKFTGTLPTMQCATIPDFAFTYAFGIPAAAAQYPYQFTGISIGDTYANDISILNLAEGAAFTVRTTADTPNFTFVT